MADRELVKIFRQGPKVWQAQLNQAGSLPRSRELFDFSGEDFTGVEVAESFSFPKPANFDGCTFDIRSIHVWSTDLTFRGAVFKRTTSWLFLADGGRVDFTSSRFEGATKFALHAGRVMPQVIGRGTEFLESAAFTNITFGALDFTQASFRGATNFQNCKFGASTSFLEAKFWLPPNFHNADLHQDIQFNSAARLDEQFLDKSSLEAERTFRTLKLQMHKAQAVSEELAFARLELKAKASREPYRTAWLYKLYDIASDYGQSTFRPLATFILLTIVAWQVAVGQTNKDITAFDSRLLAFVLNNSLPFVGGLKSFSPEHLKDVFQVERFWLLQLLAILQNLGSAICIFLFALAVRNKLRLRG